MQEILANPGASIISLLTLTILEIVLGVDNVIFVSIIMGRMKKEDQKKARRLWMIFGIAMRVILLLGLTWLISFKDYELFNILGKKFTPNAVIMLGGGLFLLVKTVGEIHKKLEGEEHGANASLAGSFGKLMVQIVLVDMVFSFDSIITAVGIVDHVQIMIIAVVIAMIVMFTFAKNIASFIEKHPTIKMLALSFLVMIGLVLIIEGWDAEKAHEIHLKNYVYFGMAFSFAVELLNMRFRKKAKKAVELREPHVEDLPDDTL
jgi:predicted tellurium resistance membrane protein TerC